jgi:hypothetical protein
MPVSSGKFEDTSPHQNIAKTQYVGALDLWKFSMPVSSGKFEDTSPQSKYRETTVLRNFFSNANLEIVPETFSFLEGDFMAHRLGQKMVILESWAKFHSSNRCVV